ncbi:hypothetical protein [Streptomyces californicus]|uniref:hypothetical protein n=1 Tax=Streptomyces californicus TaxID=67351 RepID=UPI00296F7BBA|nr:hypothetical protein [Streptomyces californicus]MDW4912511.1 hypothetical protein [Streptomyces californicus]
MSTPSTARTVPRARRLLIAAAALAVVLATLQLAATSPVAGLAMCAVGALCGFGLWLRANRTVATTVMSTCLTAMWIPMAIDRVGEAAGVPEAIASWEVVPMWALALAAPAGAWLPTRHRGSRAVTVVLCHLALCATALTAAVFPAASLSTAVALMSLALLLRSGLPAALRMRLRRARPTSGRGPVPRRDDAGRLWLSTSPRDTEVLVGAYGTIAAIHRLPPGRVALSRVPDQTQGEVQAYTLNGDPDQLVEVLAGFAVADRALARELSVDATDVHTLVTAPNARLPTDVVSVDVAGIWDTETHRYLDHRVTLLADAEARGHLQHLVVRRGRLTARRRGADGQADGDRRQQRIASAASGMK